MKNAARPVAREKTRAVRGVGGRMKPLLAFLLLVSTAFSEDAPAFKELFNGKDLAGWMDVNTSKETWSVKDGLLVCSGLPIGVMRSDRQYENFILHIEWRHMKPGGNSGVFLWSDATPAPGKELPKGLEVQMLELQWPALHPTKDGQPNHQGYVSGELFGANGLEVVPENPRGKRSMSFEFRCQGAGEWNTYDVVAVDGVVKLAINGKFVNGVSQSTVRKGYLCLESEGSEIHFRNIRLLELPPGRVTPEQTAPMLK
jgi:hypothetical protein